MLLQVTEGGKVDLSDLAGAVNGLGSKLAGLEALLALSQQRVADKADAAELDNLRSVPVELQKMLPCLLHQKGCWLQAYKTWQPCLADQNFLYLPRDAGLAGQPLLLS